MFSKSESRKITQLEPVGKAHFIDEKERKYRVIVDLCYELITSQDYKKAFTLAQTAKSIDPEGSDPYCIEAQILLADQKYKDALEKIDYAIELNGDDEYLMEIKEEILLKAPRPTLKEESNTIRCKEDEQIVTLISKLNNIENAIRNNSVKKTRLKKTEKELTDFFKNTKPCDDSIIRLHTHKIALAFAEKAQSGTFNHGYGYYKKALTYYLFSGSPFHIAAAYHNLATLKEKSQKQTSPAIKCEEVLNLYKQAFYWYQTAIDQTKQTSSSHDYQAFLSTLEKYSSDVLNDIDQLEEIQSRALVCG